jgi:hypothetical protein
MKFSFYNSSKQEVMCNNHIYIYTQKNDRTIEKKTTKN